MERPVSLLSPANGIERITDVGDYSPSSTGSLVYHAVNMRAEDGFWRPRLPMWEVEQTGEAERYQAESTQGAILFDPLLGSGDGYLDAHEPRIVESAGGYLFEIETIGGGRARIKRNDGARVEGNWLVAYLNQARNFVIRTDGSSPTVIWPGTGNAFFSNGYSTQSPQSAQIPNGAGPTAFWDYRVWATQFDHQVLASDQLGQTDPDGTTDLIRFTDQRYLATQQFFSSPINAGLIVAMSPTVDLGRDTRGQGELMVHHWGNVIFGIRPGQPRPNWQGTQMVIVRSLETSAVGQYAVFNRDGGHIFRSPTGIQSMSLLASERSALGNPTMNIAERVDDLLRHEPEEYLRFANLINPVARRRMFCTISPRVYGRTRGNRGLLCANWTTQPNAPTWEGVWIPPTEAKCAPERLWTQMVTGRDGNEHKVFGLTAERTVDGFQKRLFELRRDEGNGKDYVSGKWQNIDWQLLTKRISVNSYWTEHTTKSLAILIRDARTAVTLSLYARTSETGNDQIELLKNHTVTNGCANGLRRSGPGELLIPLGDKTNAIGSARWVQFKIVGSGFASIDMTFLSSDGGNIPSEESLSAKLISTGTSPWFRPYS